MKDFTKRPSRPSVSSGTIERDFVDRVTAEARAPGGLDLGGAGIIEVEYDWKGRHHKVQLSPSDLAAARPEDPVKGRLRLQTALYLVKRDGNRCFARTPFCIMGSNPFEHPERADFDHELSTKNPERQQLRHIHLDCHPCNAHLERIRNLQWKRTVLASSGLQREKMPRTHRHAQLSNLDIERAPAEIRINLDIYPVFCRWLKDEIDEKGEITVDHAISAGAKYMRKKCGYGSVQSARAYLKMETSEEGKFEIIEGMVRRREKSSSQAANQQSLPYARNKRPSAASGETLTGVRPSRTE